jgi:hypothetical protein
MKRSAPRSDQVRPPAVACGGRRHSAPSPSWRARWRKAPRPRRLNGGQGLPRKPLITPRCAFGIGHLKPILPHSRSPGTDRSKQAPDLPNLGSNGPVQVHALAGPDPMLEIAVPVAPGPARASCPTMHSAPCPTSNCCLSTGVTGSRSRSTAPGSGHIREPSFYVGLTHGVVSHSRPPPSRSSGGFMIPTTPCAPECMWTCRTSTVCLLPR